MKKLTIVLMTLAMSITGYAQSFKVATYNIRYSIENNYKSDSIKGEDWKRRGPAVAALIAYHDFEIFGIQEGLQHQLADLLEWLPEYEYQGVGRDDGKSGGEHSAVFYNASKYKVLKTGNFWLSETPDKPSMGWDGTCCHRMCTWVHFEDVSSRKRFYVFNTHFDHQAVVARKESAKLIISKINEIAGSNPAVLTGDFNGGHDSEWYQTLKQSDLLSDTYHQVDQPYALNGSFNGFGGRTESKNIIDHVFVTKHFKTLKWGLLTDTYHGKFPSDHFPIVVELMLE